MPEDTNDPGHGSASRLATTAPEMAALKTLDNYMQAWNQRDLAAMDATFHFPHVRIASGRIHILEAASARPSDFFDRFIKTTGWDYSLWDYRQVIQSNHEKVHFAVQFTRYKEDNSVIGHYPSLWIVALIDNKWGVQARSSFAP